MNFSFDINDSQVSANTGNYFKPYTINKINKISAKFETGNKKDGTPWKAMDVTFTGPDGSIRERYFVPNTDADGEARGDNKEKGAKGCFPAPYERLKQLVVHILGVYYPTGFEKLKKVAPKVKNMQQFLDTFVKLLNEAPENETDIKVIGRNSNGKVYAALPNVCGVSKSDDGSYVNAEGKPNPIYPINIIGKGLEFTSFEIQQKNKLGNAKPTDMSKEVENDNKLNDEDDLDLANLDLDSI